MKSYHIVFFIVGGLLILLGLLLLVTGFSRGEDGLYNSFDASRAIMVAVCLCGGVFAIVGPFCKRK